MLEIEGAKVPVKGTGHKEAIVVRKAVTGKRRGEDQAGKLQSLTQRRKDAEKKWGIRIARSSLSWLSLVEACFLSIKVTPPFLYYSAVFASLRDTFRIWTLQVSWGNQAGELQSRVEDEKIASDIVDLLASTQRQAEKPSDAIRNPPNFLPLAVTPTPKARHAAIWVASFSGNC